MVSDLNNKDVKQMEEHRPDEPQTEIIGNSGESVS